MDYSTAIVQMGSQLKQFSEENLAIAKQIPPGPQRIRGIAGSGKTVLLCQKAAYMHLQHPEWDIALVFFTRSLYDLMEKQVDRWLRYFSNGEKTYSRQNSKLKVFHVWGARDRNGLYRKIVKAHGLKPFPLDNNKNVPPEKLAGVVLKLLETTEIEPMFDAILMDEGHDLVVRDELKYGDKQPIYWMAWQALRPVDEKNPEQKRLIWAYDEAQSLHALNIPTAKELFGEEYSKLVQGLHRGGIQKSIIMKRCYRTPHQILTAAHAIGMGLLRSEGMLSGYTQKKDWENIGYKMTVSASKERKITLHRPPENSPNPMPEIWQKPVLEFNAFESREAELNALAKNLESNLENDGLQPSRNILVVVLGSNRDEALKLQQEVAEFLIDRGIPIYIPTALDVDDLERNDKNRDSFWHPGGVTISLIHRAKGNEAEIVYVVGFDRIAENENKINLRNAIFVALTRARGWAVLSGIGEYPMYDEMRQVIASGDSFSFTYRRPSRNLGE
ncbi:MAG: ATP-binding domain-containing protein [Cyanobacteriota bacterium]|nr:ATP-binding domain-containing protein [Cyanobacteriota bacterium]